MKKKLLTLFASLGLLCSLPSCGGSVTNYIFDGDTYFISNAYVDMSNPPRKISFALSENKNVTGVLVGDRLPLEASQYTYVNGILTILTDTILSGNGVTFNVNPGVSILTVTFDDQTTLTREINFVSKFIKNVDDLLSISTNLNGSYMLLNDIDCSSVKNFEPIGTSIQPFSGVFDGNGFALKNITSRYNQSLSNNSAIVNGNPSYTHFSHQSGSPNGIFYSTSSNAIIQNVKFENCEVWGRTISGIVCGTNNGTIRNVLVDSNSSISISTNYYDPNCNAGAICGMNTVEGEIYNTISMAPVNIANTFNDLSTGQMFYAQDPYFADSNSTDGTTANSNGVYSGVGMTWGDIRDNVGLSFKTTFGTTANYSQIHLERVRPNEGADSGSITNCKVLTENEFKVASNFEGYDKNIWNIIEGNNPSLSNCYKTETYPNA